MWRQEEAGDRFYSMISMSLVNKHGGTWWRAGLDGRDFTASNISCPAVL